MFAVSSSIVAPSIRKRDSRLSRGNGNAPPNASSERASVIRYSGDSGILARAVEYEVRHRAVVVAVFVQTRLPYWVTTIIEPPGSTNAAKPRMRCLDRLLEQHLRAPAVCRLPMRAPACLRDRNEVARRAGARARPVERGLVQPDELCFCARSDPYRTRTSATPLSHRFSPFCASTPTTRSPLLISLRTRCSVSTGTFLPRSQVSSCAARLPPPCDVHEAFAGSIDARTAPGSRAGGRRSRAPVDRPGTAGAP